MRAALHYPPLVVLFWLVPAVAFCALPQPKGAATAASPVDKVDFAPQPRPDPSGTYQGRAPAADAAKRVFTLNLGADGSAILTTLYIGKSDAVQHGSWTQNGSQILLTFAPMGPNRPPQPITFRHHGNQLSPIHWDPSEWGRAGPPVLYRSRPKPVSTSLPLDLPASRLPLQGGL